MSTGKALLIVGGLLGSTMLVTAALSAAGAFGGGPRGMDCGGGFEGMGGPGMGRHGGFGGRMMRFADADQDGIVTRAEALKRVDEQFDRLDLDHDGTVTAEEAINARIKGFEPQLQRMMRGLDSNGDGKLAKEEFAAPMVERLAQRDGGPLSREEVLKRIDQRFARLDLNSDGAITTDEMINRRIKRFEGHVRRHVRGLDANSDGKVTKEEFEAPVSERFADLDADGDGKLTAEELPGFMTGGGWGGGWGHGRHHHGGWAGRFMPGGPAAPAPDGAEGGPDDDAPEPGDGR